MMSVRIVVIELAGGGGARPQAEGKKKVLSRVRHGSDWLRVKRS